MHGTSASRADRFLVAIVMILAGFGLTPVLGGLASVVGAARIRSRNRRSVGRPVIGGAL